MSDTLLTPQTLAPFPTSELFLKLINQLEEYLDDLNQSTEHIGARRLVEKLAKENELINIYKVDLVEFLELRNAIVHKTTGKAIAEPHQEVLKQLQNLLSLLQNPPRALDIAARPVYTCSTSDYLVDVMTKMNNSFFTSIPVYHDQHFVGVFSYKTLSLWLGKQHGQVNVNEILISQVQEHFDQENDKFNSYQFMSVDTDVYTIRRAFTAFTKEKKRLGAIFITQHGQKNEDIQGIITAWDLPKISVRGL